MPHQRERNAVRSSDRIVDAPPPSLDDDDDDDDEPRDRRHRRRFAIKLAFDGTTYRGFQSQPHRNTIQDQVESRLRGLLRRPVRIEAWGRTDSGVHATGAVVTIDLYEEEVIRLAGSMMLAGRRRRGGGRGLPPTEEEEEVEVDATTARAARFLHSVLREFVCDAGGGDDERCDPRLGSIVARSVVLVPCDFDARYSARWKRYAYYVRATTTTTAGEFGGRGGCGGGSSPFAWGRHSWRVGKTLDHDAMVEAASMISDGERNFEWMCVSQRGEMRDTRRMVTLRVERVPMPPRSPHEQDGDDDGGGQPYFLRRNDDDCGVDDDIAIYRIHCTCDFFLYKMMRRIVGVLVAVGGGDASLDALRSCLDEYDDYYYRRDDDDDDDDDQSQNDGADAGAKKKKKKNKPTVPPKLLHTAPAKGLCLEHIEYDVVI